MYFLGFFLFYFNFFCFFNANYYFVNLDLTAVRDFKHRKNSFRLTINDQLSRCRYGAAILLSNNLIDRQTAIKFLTANKKKKKFAACPI